MFCFLKLFRFFFQTFYFVGPEKAANVEKMLKALRDLEEQVGNELVKAQLLDTDATMEDWLASEDSAKIYELAVNSVDYAKQQQTKMNNYLNS